jgi:hypothetical protein
MAVEWQRPATSEAALMKRAANPFVRLPVAAGAIAIAVFVSARASFPVALGCAAVAAGCATAAVKARIVDHTVPRATAYGVAVFGFVDRGQTIRGHGPSDLNRWREPPAIHA